MREADNNINENRRMDCFTKFTTHTKYQKYIATWTMYKTYSEFYPTCISLKNNNLFTGSLSTGRRKTQTHYNEIIQQHFLSRLDIQYLMDSSYLPYSLNAYM